MGALARSHITRTVHINWSRNCFQCYWQTMFVKLSKR